MKPEINSRGFRVPPGKKITLKEWPMLVQPIYKSIYVAVLAQWLRDDYLATNQTAVPMVMLPASPRM